MAFAEKMEELSRMLECPICFERMVTPRMLSCLHSFCEKCLRQHVASKQQDGKFPCPICNTDYQVPEEGMAVFRQNTFLNQISELFPDQSEAQCDVCKLRGSQMQAVATCLQCKDHMCKECSQYHDRSRATATHQVVALEEIRSGHHLEKFWQTQKTFCDIHKDEAIKIYCEDCQKPVCLLCKALDHDQHKMKNIEEATKDACEVIRSMMEPWKKAAEHSELLCKERKKIVDNMDTLESEAVSELRRIFSTCKTKVLGDMESEQETALNDLSKQVKLARKPVEEAYNDGDLMHVKITSALKYAHKVLGSELNVQILQQFSIIKNRFEELNIHDVDTTVKEPKFTFQPNQLTVPDLKVNAVTNFEDRELRSKFAEHVSRKPLDKGLLLCTYSTKRQGENGCNCVSLSANDKWFIVADTQNMKVKVFDKVTCRFVLELDQETHKIGQISDVACSNFNIFVTDDNIHGVVKYDAKGQVLKVTRDMYQTSGFVACGSSNLAVADMTGGRILITDLDCNIKQTIDATSLGLDAFQPRNLYFTHLGNLSVIDQGFNRLHVINYKCPKVTHTYLFDNKVISPAAVCVDVWGNIFVADSSSHNPAPPIYVQVQQYDKNYYGTTRYVQQAQQQHASQIALFSYPNGEISIPMENGEVTNPAGLAVFAPGEVVVLDQAGNIKIYEYLAKGVFKP